ncbi:type II toxin-antitoxin system VapB family antitoxin [Jiella sp. M17.18]|uniref:type II toxin-antitoxin system VapB family antitoxin n=1 Tax=Jiella sp. M17.18 TaxID=3234247 RepID=UPI0034E02E55
MKDPEVGELAERLATLKQTSKTEAVREALREALAASSDRPVPDGVPDSIARQVKEAMDFVAELHRKYPSEGPGLPVTKEWIDSLYED